MNKSPLLVSCFIIGIFFSCKDENPKNKEGISLEQQEAESDIDSGSQLNSNKKLYFNPGSIIILTGLFPFHSLVVREGLSAKTVFFPTKIPASSLRHLCTKRFVYSLLIKIRSESEPIFPFALCAHFKIM